MQQKNILKHFTVIGIGTTINLLLGLISTPIITRIVDPEKYGQFSMFMTYSSIAVMVLCIGLDQTLVRYYYMDERIEYKRALLFKCIIIPLAITLSLGILIIAINYYCDIELEFDTRAIIALCVYTLIKLIYRFSQLLVRLEYNSKLYSTLNILDKGVYLIVAYILLLVEKTKQLEMLIIALMVSGVITLVISVVNQKNIWSFRSMRLSTCRYTIVELCKYGYPFIFSMGLMTFFQAIDRLSLNMYRNYSEVGIYASTNSIISLFAIVQTTFNALWSPLSIEYYTKNPDDKSIYKKANGIITVLMFAIGITMILCKDLFALLLGEKYRGASYILPFLVFHPIMYTISETTVCGIVFLKKSKAHIIVTLVACVSNLIGNTILVPKLGGQGAAISTGIAYILFFTMRTLISNHYYYVDYGLKKFYILTAAVAAYAGICSFVKFNIGSVIGFMICIGLLVCFYNESIKWMVRYVKERVITKLLWRRKNEN